MPVVVERVGLVALDGAAPLFDAYRQFYGSASDVVAARAFLAARLVRDESIVLLARAGPARDAAGFAQLYHSFSSLSLGTTVILNDLFVAPAWRRTGVARHLVDAAVAQAAAAGAVRIDLATQHANVAALALYRSLGFIPDTEFAHLSLALHDR